MAGITHEEFIHHTIARTIDRARDALGRAHYERMRAGMHPEVAIAPWDELSERTREAYRAKLDYLLPVVSSLVAGLVWQANEHEHSCGPRTLADLS